MIRASIALVGLCSACLALGTPAVAEEAGATDATPVERALAERRQETERDIEALRQSLALSESRRGEIRETIETATRDLNLVTAALIQSAKSEKKLSDDVAELASDLTRLASSEEALLLSLNERGLVLGEVLAALQRMGLNPPPALLIRPEDALGSVRSAMMLGAVVPGMRDETLQLREELAALSRVLAETRRKRETLTERLSAQVEERERFNQLLAEKERLIAEQNVALTDEEQRAEALAGDLGSLEELLGTIDRKIADVAAAARDKREAIERAQAQNPGAVRLGPAARFAEMRGQLSLPVSGTLINRFANGASQPFSAAGDTIATRSGAIVITPVDAVVAFAAPFRSYGNVVILDVGDGYSLVLTGLGTVNVSAGQTLLAGEPLGAMRETRIASAAATGIDLTTPELYIELRQNGQAIDPGPWWLADQSGMIGNDA